MKGLAVVRLYNLNNELLGSSRPLKFSLSKGEQRYMTYPFDVSKVPAGTYRLDLAVEGTAVWRTFIRVVD